MVAYTHQLFKIYFMSEENRCQINFNLTLIVILWLQPGNVFNSIVQLEFHGSNPLIF